MEMLATEVNGRLVAAAAPAPTESNALSFLTTTTRPTLCTDLRGTAAGGRTTALCMRR
jgi:hypothetical protein